MDLLVSEVLGSDLLGEGVLLTIADAARRLLAPGGRMIPEAAELRVALASWSGLAARRVGEISGFDLTPFNRLARTPLPASIGDETLALASDDQPLFAFDFQQAARHMRGDVATVELTARGGPADGVAGWIRVRLDEKTVYENRPGSGRHSAWYVLFAPFESPRDLAAGQVVTVRGRHSADGLWFWTDF